MSASRGEPGLEPRDAFDVESVLSGESGIVAGRRARTRALLGDLLDDAALWSRLVPPRLDRAARGAASGTVLALGLYSARFAPFMEGSVREVLRSRRKVELLLGALDEPTPALERYTASS